MRALTKPIKQVRQGRALLVASSIFPNKLSLALSLLLSLSLAHALSLSSSLREARRPVTNILLLTCTLNSVSLRLSTHPPYTPYIPSIQPHISCLMGRKTPPPCQQPRKDSVWGREASLPGWMEVLPPTRQVKDKTRCKTWSTPTRGRRGAGDKGPRFAGGHACFGAEQYSQQGARGIRKHSEAW